MSYTYLQTGNYKKSSKDAGKSAPCGHSGNYAKSIISKDISRDLVYSIRVVTTNLAKDIAQNVSKAGY